MEPKMKKNNAPKLSLLATHTAIPKKATKIEGLAEISFPKMAIQAKRPRLNLAIAIDAGDPQPQLAPWIRASVSVVSDPAESATPARST